ncbi:TetR/AcrR family transcriptional regulator [Streptomyces sp. NPDC054833]
MRKLLADSGDTNAGIRTVADLADVGFGSFYNHFTCRPDLFDAAVADALEEFARAVDRHLCGVDDPAERLADGVRLSARVADSHPEIMRILCHSELGRICAGRGPAPRARRDVEQGMASGRFTVVDPVIALTALNGSLLALLQLWSISPRPTGTMQPEKWPRCSCTCSASPRTRPVTSPDGPFPLRREGDVLSADDTDAPMTGDRWIPS